MKEALALFEEAGDRNFTARTRAYRGYAALIGGDPTRARAFVAESLVEFRELGEEWGIAEGLEAMSAVCAVNGEGERAGRLAGAAAGLRARLSTQAMPFDRALVDR